MNLAKWSTVIIRPSLWWRLKLLFRPSDLIFCWGEDRYMLKGFLGETYVAIGGVPTHMRQRLRNDKCEIASDTRKVSE